MISYLIPRASTSAVVAEESKWEQADHADPLGFFSITVNWITDVKFLENQSLAEDFLNRLKINPEWLFSSF